jgi:DNA-binding transcriptional MerR regulator
MPSDLLTSGQIAKMLSVHRTTVHHWERSGRLKSSGEVNGIRLFRRSDVERFAAEREEAKA